MGLLDPLLRDPGGYPGGLWSLCCVVGARHCAGVAVLVCSVAVSPACHACSMLLRSAGTISAPASASGKQQAALHTSAFSPSLTGVLIRSALQPAE
jgi:phosphatidylglycerophosphate synthase